MSLNIYPYKEWTYKFDDGNHKVESPMELPSRVYKYYPNNCYSRDAVRNQYLFCSHPYHLNDSMDCSALLWDFSNLSRGLFEKFFKDYGFNECFEMDYEKDKANGFEEIKHLLFDLISNECGIISLTTEPLQTLMWAHYSSEKGFMIELDWEEVKNSLRVKNSGLNNYVFFPIQYVTELESIDFFNQDFGSPDVPFLYSTGVKRDEWKYENEWRLIPYSNNYGVPNSLLSPIPNIQGKQERKLNYPLNAIRSVTLGKQFFNGSNVEVVISSLTYKMNIGQDLEFLNFLFECLNDKLYLCGEYESGKKFSRSAEKIVLEKIDGVTFKIVPQNEGFFQ